MVSDVAVAASCHALANWKPQENNSHAYYCINTALLQPCLKTTPLTSEGQGFANNDRLREVHRDATTQGFLVLLLL